MVFVANIFFQFVICLGLQCMCTYFFKIVMFSSHKRFSLIQVLNIFTHAFFKHLWFPFSQLDLLLIWSFHGLL